jgi:hypothetical protein
MRGRLGLSSLVLKRAGSVFQENPEIKQILYHLRWFQDTGNPQARSAGCLPISAAVPADQLYCLYRVSG